MIRILSRFLRPPVVAPVPLIYSYSWQDREALNAVARLIVDHSLELEVVAQVVGDHLEEHDLADPSDIRDRLRQAEGR